MKITKGELFQVENAIKMAVQELIDSKFKSYIVNDMIDTNLEYTTKLCDSYRSELSTLRQPRLVELAGKNEDSLNEDEKSEKESLIKSFNEIVNNELMEVVDVEFYKGSVDKDKLSNYDLGFDSTRVINFLLK